VVGLSILSGSQAELIPAVLRELEAAGASVPVPWWWAASSRRPTRATSWTWWPTTTALRPFRNARYPGVRFAPACWAACGGSRAAPWPFVLDYPAPAGAIQDSNPLAIARVAERQHNLIHLTRAPLPRLPRRVRGWARATHAGAVDNPPHSAPQRSLAGCVPRQPDGRDFWRTVHLSPGAERLPNRTREASPGAGPAEPRPPDQAPPPTPPLPAQETGAAAGGGRRPPGA
jgi:hypothetical protein